ncbi:MAG: hypothetical protein A3I89_02485 [Candidatus Harrisonbacteria bacterium RIFCSPLOWO2_02_FULL_41_11]|uniref:NYN domain-containing protein n=1 Tax=Candidatus Harrisonbacteria bacterium RIFCSPHIGHO2_02_FULL_42_16 TaxID=1798404 RepID=A0A1G1ZJ58_9BACT|nr:MAG: hypothetical protein A3B92_00200 [Candidatus Harrisonbacteria bacterium RIFCSPHIGHO2_02_FULL_42_16]OGY66532.1 MAG: hypothetical protein A3I89_02485 [Candidatus Harrisonbacteria bacterium RIFCSPLOWO2_02_FULL_41_11]
MKNRESNYAFIDSNNLHLSIKELGWKLDYKKFYVYLKDKHHITKAYLFLGFLSENQEMYKKLQDDGYTLVFKPILQYKDGKVKGNCDAELVLQAMIDFAKYDKALLVSGDGDFYCLINYLYGKQKLKFVLVPNQNKYSALIKKSAKEKLLFMNNLRHKLEYKDNQK